MHPFSVVTVVIFVAGYITARWDLVTRLYELAIFAIDRGVLVYASGTVQLNIKADERIDANSQRLCDPINILFPSCPTYRTPCCERDKPCRKLEDVTSHNNAKSAPASPLYG